MVDHPKIVQPDSYFVSDPEAKREWAAQRQRGVTSVDLLLTALQPGDFEGWASEAFPEGYSGPGLRPTHSDVEDAFEAGYGLSQARLGAP